MAYLDARSKDRQLREYGYDLLWMLVRTKYENFTAPMPSEINRPKKKDERTAAQIIHDLREKLTA